MSEHSSKPDAPVMISCSLGLEDFTTRFEADLKWAHPMIVRQWFNDRGDDELLAKHDLNSGSVVVDIGGYTGAWSAKINDIYSPRLFVLEPVGQFLTVLKEKFSGHPNVKVCGYGLGAAGSYDIYVQGDGSSMFTGSDTGTKETITIKSIDAFIAETGIDRIDLLQMNIEGAEYDLMDMLLEHPLLKRINRMQIQYHLTVDNFEQRRARIRERLADTHLQTFNYPFVWEGWQRRAD